MGLGAMGYLKVVAFRGMRMQTLTIRKIFRLRVMAMGALVALLPLFGGMARAADELAPGYAECIGKVESFEDELACNEKAHRHQSARLEAAYKKARKLCGEADGLQCRNELKKLELAWLDFTKRTYAYLLNEGIFGPYEYENPEAGGQIPRAKAAAEEFAAQETKRQADRLEYFCKLWERWQ